MKTLKLVSVTLALTFMHGQVGRRLQSTEMAYAKNDFVPGDVIFFDDDMTNEKLGEINRIATLMKKNPDLKFSVEGHTNSTGNATSNQTLSESRSQAIVDKLVENGIASDRLKAAGKGQTSPITDNGPDEGRAKTGEWSL